MESQTKIIIQFVHKIIQSAIPVRSNIIIFMKVIFCDFDRKEKKNRQMNDNDRDWGNRLNENRTEYSNREIISKLSFRNDNRLRWIALN